MTAIAAIETPVQRGRFSRLYHGETKIDFMGRKWWGIGLSALLIVVTIVSLFARGLNLGLEFKGGIEWDVPSAHLSEDQARDVLKANGIDAADAVIDKITPPGNGSNQVAQLRIQTKEQTLEVSQKVISDLSTAAQVDVKLISTNSVTSSWGSEITKSAVRALVVFLALVALFIAWRFEFRMAASAIVAMIHDVLISVGVYSVLQLQVTPATVIAFLTILGFSLYDTIVVVDKVDENTARFAGARLPYDDVINVSMNQVLMRSLNTSIAAVLPVLSLLVIGAGILGAVALREFALALFVGLLTGSYSSIFIASPLLAELKSRSPKYRNFTGARAVGADLERLVLGGSPSSKRDPGRTRVATISADAADAAGPVVGPGAARPRTPDAVLTHPPRPRKKTRR
ncbi:MAG TPA: protein translocase subunit SecF [Ilumatobacteraceae bacterium]